MKHRLAKIIKNTALLLIALSVVAVLVVSVYGMPNESYGNCDLSNYASLDNSVHYIAPLASGTYINWDDIIVDGYCARFGPYLRVICINRICVYALEAELSLRWDEKTAELTQFEKNYYRIVISNNLRYALFDAIDSIVFLAPPGTIEAIFNYYHARSAEEFAERGIQHNFDCLPMRVLMPTPNWEELLD